MNSMITSTCGCILSAIALTAIADEETALRAPRGETLNWGKLTATENLIRREILRLDGDWEAWSKPKLVGFLGPKFESPHFEMLTHLPSVEWFSAQYCAVDDHAIKCISSINNLKLLAFVGCDMTATCMSLLRSNRELRELQIEETRLSDKAMDGITQLSQVEVLDLSDVDLSDVSDTTLGHLARMSSLKECYFWKCEGMTPERLEKLKAAMPNVEWK